jgi:hypothetical protein
MKNQRRRKQLKIDFHRREISYLPIQIQGNQNPFPSFAIGLKSMRRAASKGGHEKITSFKKYFIILDKFLCILHGHNALFPTGRNAYSKFCNPY